MVWSLSCASWGSVPVCACVLGFVSWYCLWGVLVYVGVFVVCMARICVGSVTGFGKMLSCVRSDAVNYIFIFGGGGGGGY